MTTIEELIQFMQHEVNEDKKTYDKAGIDHRVMLTRRGLIIQSQLGDLARFVYHDPSISPGARPHGGASDEDSTFGHAILQVIGLAVARGRDPVRGLQMARKALEEKDWKRREANGEFLKGNVAHMPEPGMPLMGMAVIVRDERETLNLGAYPSYILFMEHPRPEHTPMLLHPSVRGIVTDQGGTMCHAAIVSREANKACIVGTGNASTIVKNGQRVFLHHDGRIVASEW